MSPVTTRDVAVIGAGAAGLVAGHHLRREGHEVPGHGEVFEYLKDYGNEFGVCEMIRFDTEVCRVWRNGIGKWEVRSRKVKSGGEGASEVFDAVVVCNGHHTEPRIAYIPEWLLLSVCMFSVFHINWSWKIAMSIPPGQIHSHNYRVPEPYRNKIVILIGSSASAVDISRETASVAKEVHIASRSTSYEEIATLPGYDNIWLRPMMENAYEDGTISFPNGVKISADIILHCTGYKYHFPFLDTEGIVTVDDNKVGPLYKHVFPPALAPWLSFVGVPWKVVPFPRFEFQSRWIAGTLTGWISLPSPDEMTKDVEAFYSSLQSSGIPKRYTHNMGGIQVKFIKFIIYILRNMASLKVEIWVVGSKWATFSNGRVVLDNSASPL
nr:flavin-containing monooxygenase FMO GS-OX-like 4 [Tanacetum cinerariifolium]